MSSPFGLLARDERHWRVTTDVACHLTQESSRSREHMPRPVQKKGENGNFCIALLYPREPVGPPLPALGLSAFFCVPH